MQNRIFRGGEAAVASIDVAGQASGRAADGAPRDPSRAGRVRGDARPGRRARVSVVRPFPARVVRPEWARRLVTGLSELPEDTGTLPAVAPIDPAAYDESEAALYVYRQARGGCPAPAWSAMSRSVRSWPGRCAGTRPCRASGSRAWSVTTRDDRCPTGAGRAAAPRRPGLRAHARRGVQDAADPRLRRPSRLRQTVWRVAPGAATASLATSWPPRTTTSPTATTGSRPRSRRGATAASPRTPASSASSTRWTACGCPRSTGASSGPWTPPPSSTCSPRLPGRRPRPLRPPGAHGAGSFGLYADGGWYDVTPRAVRCGPRRRGPSGAGPRPPRPGRRDRARADAGRRADPPVRRRRGASSSRSRRRPLEALTRLADAGEVMPPKTTYFEPKPCAGIFRRP